MCYMKDMHVFEREVNGRRYRVAAQSIWDPVRGRSVARQAVLGPATAPPVADLSATRTVGTQAIGDVGALIWVAEQLDLIGHIDRACGYLGAKGGPSIGELAVAVAIQRACSPGPKRDLAEFLDGAVPRLSCLPSSAFSGQAYHRVAQQVTDEQLEQAQIVIAKAAVARFELSADVLAFDTTNFELTRRGHAKSKRSDLRVVGLGVLVSETGHVPLLYRTYAGNSSDQAVLTACLDGLRALHQSLDDGECRERAQRTLVRDGGFWSPQLELDLDTVGYYSLISLPLGHAAAEQALQMAAKRGAMKPLPGKLAQVRAARVLTKVGNLDRTLVVVESQELLEGQKRGIAVALRKAKAELSKLDRLVRAKRISRSSLEQRIRKTLGREYLSRFVVTESGGDDQQPTLRWHVDAAMRRQLEKTRLGRRVLCTDHHLWSTGRIVQAFRGQWNVEELFRRAKKGGVVPWGPSHQWADGFIRLHTFATVLGLMLVSLAKIALGTGQSTLALMGDLAEIRATLVRTTTGGPGRRATVMIAPELSISQRRAVQAFDLERWLPSLLSCMTTRPVQA
ncbi:MAG: transposase [Acidobacteriia bacterium]|nr:transposase [Terriglobia bacterium]